MYQVPVMYSKLILLLFCGALSDSLLRIIFNWCRIHHSVSCKTRSVLVTFFIKGCWIHAAKAHDHIGRKGEFACKESKITYKVHQHIVSLNLWKSREQEDSTQVLSHDRNDHWFAHEKFVETTIQKLVTKSWWY